MAGVRADILDVERGVAPQLTLQVEAPLILAGVGKPARRRDHVRPPRRTDDAGRSIERQRRIGRIVEVDGRERRIVGQERERVHLVRVVVDPEPARTTVFSLTIGRAEPRRDVLVVRLVELEAHRRQRRGDDRLEILGEHRRQPFVGLDRRVQLVAEAEAQREVPRRLPHVVDEEAVAPAADVALNLIGGRNHVRGRPSMKAAIA